MSLLAHRFPADIDRASVVLPTVKCSSCAASIPLNFLGEHVCTGPPTYDHGRQQQQQRQQQQRQQQQQQQQQRQPLPPQHRSSPSPHLDPIPTLPHRPTTPSLMPSGSGGSLRVGDVVRGHSPDPARSPAPGGQSPWRPHDELPDTTSGGGAGMAGVGRRAFAAAAWSVRAGVALAASTGRGFVHEEPEQMSPQLSPVDITRMPEPSPTGSPRVSPTTGPNGRPNRSPTSRGPVILPKAPLAHRPSGPSRSTSRNDDYRSVSQNDNYRSASRNDAISLNDDFPRPHLERSGSSPASSGPHARDDRQQNTAFFDRYRQMLRSKSDQTHTSTPADSPREEDASRYSYATSLDETSSLPWATASTADDETATERFEHHRYPTNGSFDSTNSSSASHEREDRQGASSSLETEVVITPSQSWEGLAERSMSVDTKFDSSPGSDKPGALALIGEEEEDDDDDLYDFGAPQVNRKSSGIPRSSSEHTVTPHSHSPPRRNRPIANSPPRKMDPPRMGLATHSDIPASQPTSRPKRVCARCGDAVGGSRRYVERDGIVLCETDWKKMYLPACRRCKLPIEKSAVSSSDGQLKGKWHRACFACTRCEAPFDGDDFYVHDGRPWCQYHYAEENGTLCASSSCRKPIEGACILAPSVRGDERFHPGHLRCEHRGGVSGTQNCRDPMTEYYDIGGERFCERHAGKATRLATGGTQRAEKRRTKLIELPRAGV